jgi:Protein of unknown function (DUF3152)
MRIIVIAAVALLLAGCGTAQPPAYQRAGKQATAGSPAPSPSPPVPLVVHGPGTFTSAPGGTDRVGESGELMHYRVELEDSVAIDPAEFAATVDLILADPRGWTAGGQWSFQRVPGEAPLVVRLATPDTVDAICAQYGLDTGGEVSCRGGDYVMINLRRWLQGVPHFDGDLGTYRQYLVNHEVGHRLGFGHVGCPAPGGPAPVMLQQTLTLDGCLPNAWPYVDGELLTGPP